MTTSPAGDELVERLKRELALAQTMWKVARDDVAKEFKAAIRFAKIADQQKTRADRAEAALASERSARQAAEAERERLHTPRPESEWNEEDGPVLWWLLPVSEPPYCGSPLDDDWPGYHTHWTPLPSVEAITALASQQEGAGL